MVVIDPAPLRLVDSWASEVGVNTFSAVHEAMEEGFSSIELFRLGRGPADVVRVASNSLDISCHGRQCEQYRERLATNLAAAASVVAEDPIGDTGLISATNAAASACGDRACRLVVLSNGLDPRLFKARSVDEIMARFGTKLSGLENLEVSIVGFGAGATRRERRRLQLAMDFWEQALANAGARKVLVTRSPSGESP